MVNLRVQTPRFVATLIRLLSCPRKIAILEAIYEAKTVAARPQSFILGIYKSKLAIQFEITFREKTLKWGVRRGEVVDKKHITYASSHFFR
jgi:hypothetical protein